MIETFNTLASSAIVASLFTLGINYFFQKGEIRKKELRDERRKYYIQIHEDIHKVLNKRDLLLDDEYYEVLGKNYSAVCLLGTEELIKKYSEYAKHIYSLRVEYEKFISDNDPEAYSDEGETTMSNEYDMQKFKDAKYNKRLEIIENHKVKPQLKDILKQMRKDLKK